MNLTISVDDDLIERARDLARRRGVSLQDLLREYLRTLVGDRPATQVADELAAVWEESPGHSGGRRIRREEAYEERLK
jgi:hypothetical protein